ncbi:MAG: leucine-rich repeat protein [Lachnospiraceae bacterium]|nr:leucine-rich repeat protein [Lachnospiraceae bacterium]
MKVVTNTPSADSTSQIKKAVFEKGVTSVGATAFYGCENLTSISFADSIISIGDNAFAECTILTSVTLPESLDYMGFGVFAGTGLTSIAIPDSVTSMGYNVFGNCENLSQVSWGSSLTSIPYLTFYGCSNLTNFTVPSHVQTIEGNAFEYAGLTNITFSSSLVDIGNGAFTGTPLLDSLSAQGDFAVVDHILIKYNGDGGAVTIPDNVVNIAGGAFYGCSLSSIVIPEGVTVIGEYAFYMTGLTSVTIPKTVTSIGNTALGYEFFEGASGKGPEPVEFTIYGYTGTAAETYAATSNKFTFVALDSSAVTLEACKISSLTNAAKGIKIKWSKVSGASGYIIYRKTATGSYTKVKTIKSGSTVSYTDKKVASQNGTVYTYKVIPYSGSTKGSGMEVTTARLAGTALASVKNSAAGKAKVKWTAVSGVIGYQIQYSTDKSFGTYKTKNVSGSSKKAKTLSGLAKGSTYYVRIRTYKTVDGTKYYSAWSSKLNVTITK